MPVVNIKGVGPAQFPDGMSADDIRSFLRKKYYQDMTSKTPTITPLPHTAAPYEPTLAERLGRNIGDILTDTGIVSDNYGAQRIGSNIASIGEFLPVIGDASAGDDFGRAAAEGDKLGMGLASLGVIPIAGDALKKSIEPMSELSKFSDKTSARRSARLDVFHLPTKGKAESIKHITDLTDYTPQQLVSQMKVLDSTGIRQGGHLSKGDKVDTFYSDDGTSKLIDSETGDVIFDMDAEQTENVIKNDILSRAEGTLTQEQKAAAYQERKLQREAEAAREAKIQEGYKMQHTAPMLDDNPAGNDLTSAYGDDIYTGNARRYYGTGASYDDKAIRIIQNMRNKPEKQVTIYRAVPKDVKEINPSDWVTTTREYANDHAKGEKGWHVISKKVKAKEIANDGNSIHEFGYDPR